MESLAAYLVKYVLLFRISHLRDSDFISKQAKQNKES
jgi:hypothetical protein